MSYFEPVITGLGVVAPIGVGIDAFWENLSAGRSGIGWLAQYDASRLPRSCQVVGEARNLGTPASMGGITGRMANRLSQFAVATCRMAISELGLLETASCTEFVY